MPPLHYGEDECCPFLGRCCRRYAAPFTAVGTAFHSTANVNAAHVSAVGVGVVLPVLLLLVPHLRYGEGKCCQGFGRWL